MAENVGAVSFGVNLDNSGISSQVNSLGSSIGATFHNIVSGAFSVVLGQGLFSLVTSGFKNSISAAWDFNSTMQSATTSFTTLLHSAGEASSLVSQLNAIDQASTLDMTDLSKAAQEMISFGVNSSQVVPTIKELGDISQGNSEKFNALALAFSQTSSAGKLTGQDLLQYISAGFNPLQVIAQKTGKSMAELRDEMGKGQISAADVAGAFQTATSAGGAFYNATADASKTYSGQMAMLGSSVTETLGAMIKPAFTDFTNNVLPHLISIMGTVSDTFNSTGSVTDAVAAGLKAAFGPDVAGAFTAIAAGVQGSIGWIAEHGTAVTAAVAGIAGAMAAFKLATLAVNAVTEIQNALFAIQSICTLGAKGAMELFEGETKGVTAAQWLLNAAMSANPITLIIIGVAALVAVFVVLWVKCAAFRNFWIGLGNDIASIAKAAVAGVVGFFKSLPEKIHQIFDAVVGFAQKWGPLILTAVAPVIGIPLLIAQHWGQIKETISKVWDNVRQVTSAAWSGIQSGLTNVWNGIRNGMTSAWNGIRTGIATAWNAIKTALLAFVSPLVNGVINLWDHMRTGIQTVMTGLKNILGGIWTVIKNVVMAPVLLIIDLVTGNFTKLRSDAVAIFTNLKNAFAQIWTGIRQVFTGALQAITGFLTVEWDGLKAMAIAVWQGITGMLTATWSALVTAAQTIFNTLVAVVQAVGNAIVTAFNAVVAFFSGLPGTIGGIMNSIGSWIRSVWDGIVGFFSGLPGRIGSTMDAVGSWVRSVWDGLIGFVGGIPGRFASGLSALGGAVRGAFDDAIGFIKNLPSEALQWGSDIIDGIVNGIKSAANHVRDAVNGVAQDIRSFLHFSVPDEGPLVDFQNWMPDFIQGLAVGITDNKGVLTSAVSGMAANLNSSVKTGVGGALGSVSVNSGAASAAQQSAGVTYKQEVNNYSPKALSPAETARLTRNSYRQLILQTARG